MNLQPEPQDVAKFAQTAGAALPDWLIEKLAAELRERFEELADLSGPITYTNRAARRARSKAERKSA